VAAAIGEEILLLFALKGREGVIPDPMPESGGESDEPDPAPSRGEKDPAPEPEQGHTDRVDVLNAGGIENERVSAMAGGMRRRKPVDRGPVEPRWERQAGESGCVHGRNFV